MPRGVLLSVLATALLLTSCQERVFWCMRADPEGRALRCRGSKEPCEKYLALKEGGCDPHPEAWCFLEKPIGNFKPERVCALTEADCNSWRDFRAKYEPGECKLTAAGSS